uniref:Uncharacterized protein n=1 Tax=Tanacetum cinerariifolium TaxID=118510 RepID=A0A6L2NZV9_TANCI|nr:hypothetical protein [Tanacetum cinerariifolium]
MVETNIENSCHACVVISTVVIDEADAETGLNIFPKGVRKDGFLGVKWRDMSGEAVDSIDRSELRRGRGAEILSEGLDEEEKINSSDDEETTNEEELHSNKDQTDDEHYDDDEYVHDDDKKHDDDDKEMNDAENADERKDDLRNG